MTERLIRELGCAGHLCVSHRCRWKRHTQVGLYRVSTLGDYFPTGLGGKRDTLGGGEDTFFESMVFLTTGKPDPENEGCGCYEVANWAELECARYATAGEANAGHEALIQKYRAASDELPTADPIPTPENAADGAGFAEQTEIET